MRLARITGIALAAVALVATPAIAKTTTLRFFAKTVSAKFTDSAGRPIPGRNPKAGDVFDATRLEYVGDHKHHAKQWTASAHLRCVFTSSTRSTCDGQLAIGGSMLLSNGIHPDLAARIARLRINGGTGAFQRAHGTATEVQVGSTNNNDITIRITG
jgi:hypothetical protein